MTTASSYLLIVDDSAIFLDVLLGWFRETFPEKPVLGAKSLAEAREAMAEVPIDFFLLDYRLPDGNGLDFINEVRMFWLEARFILMTLEMPDTERSALLALNPAGCFHKPFELDVLESELRAQFEGGVDGPATRPVSGFKTMLRGVSALDLIQLKCTKAATCALEFCNVAGEIGRIYLTDGEVFHAETNGAIGLDALADIIRWPDGEAHELSIWTPPKTGTIGPPWQSVLMEAAQLADERGVEPPAKSVECHAA